ncbi:MULTISPECIES: TAT-variant-translocated molybdopterin oxidoreductase [unclassified Lentimonas]|uniref:TAT-variant-translocated molybdopterin oxidoreductase n=1 Tax=unclassified Lentimonas TaxID=2630993 RepID=UPI001328265C|nr:MULTISPECIES: TAT-variant-translocated molybdopterin oxidoreductase [unclassified Lentimonas]CAA6679027.1 Molybdopterin oxidoreductase, iron-sulfur binding subunit (EC [Lentimonas sp. CC4]CAA7076394.1 Molybdopterin oxidoreductase, iron-sulfur binding subunit (EC [Lentimonas sp. CC4]CAA7183149.1 Molybdopterin oxidoreductase, iron-sulfur binding subunit (EC [Lentimonas sp. CC8]
MKNSEFSGPRYWKSLDDLAETPAFTDWVEREFPAGASEMEGVNRRQFMKVMAASFGLAGLGMAGCRRPEQTILPYSKQPENVIPGVAIYYTSSMPGARDNVPLIVETQTGRPTKIEGNPSFTPYGGSTTVYTQASILDLYDPDRATKSKEGSATLSPAAVRDRLEAIRQAHGADKGAGLVFLAEPSTSPSRAALVKQIKKAFPKATWTENTAIDQSTSEQAAQAVFGKSLRALPEFTKAKRVLALDAEFLINADGSLSQARDFTKTRKVKDSKDATKMSRLYSVESTLTTTGSMADHRLRLSTSQMGAFIAQVGAAVLNKKHVGGPLAAELAKIGASLKVDAQWVDACATDLVENAGHSIIVAGEHLPKSVHAIVIAINEALSAPINYVEVPTAEQGIATAAARLNQGDVETLVILGGNPVYDAPIDLDWSAAQAKATQSIYIGGAVNETSQAVNLFIARSHYLESWGDGRTFDGTLVPVQPMIEPLFDTFNDLEVLARLAGASATDGYSIAQATFAAEGGKDYNKFLSDGVLEGSAFKSASKKLDYAKVVKALKADELTALELNANALEVRFAPSSHAYDGRYANNGWMMECPDPITKLTWDNAIQISPSLAKELESAQGIQIFPTKKPMNEHSEFFKAAKGTLQTNKATFNRGKEEAVVVELTVNGVTIEAPIHVVPGLANYTVVLPLGMGRKVVGRVGHGVGFDAYAVRTSGSLGCALGAAIKLTEKTYHLANTQEHWSMEGRALVREGTADYYAKKPDFVNKVGVESHAPANYAKDADKSLQEKSVNQYRGNSAYDHVAFSKPAPNVKVWHDDKGQPLDSFPVPQQWGMAIDLNSCIGCTACVVACQSENNVPIVGKDQVLRGREMHWMRIDRYFSAEKYDQTEVPDDVQVSFMGMMCQHCENAPCEQVCPVNATVHDTQGLNTMAYNRCVGTRYCANNCPYKVRRFNFLDWNKRKIGEFYKGPLGPVEEPELQKMQKNPNVTVRMRGVMEKCTFCTQRIEAAKIEQKRLAGASDDIRIADGNIKVACQQACPTDAITFGDISDAESEVSQMKASDRNYSVLGYLNARPRTTYLARLRNPNPEMPDAYEKPYAYAQYDERYGYGSHGDHGADHGAGHDAHGDDHGATHDTHAAPAHDDHGHDHSSHSEEAHSAH